ncbi:MAG TPA: molybdopterin cofactor-binding domain-containing protein, partial [Candidatus Sulfopaludibacter sp.]|nr:molybdopterin cofactor-binding domain-containing protein [Candidatus Sulfopaludibacter sp.]
MNRRNFLRTAAAAAGGLMVGFSIPERLSADTPASESKLNAFVHVGADDHVTLFIHKSEMGQGTVTSLSMLLAEELECDWKKIRTEFPGVSPEYGGFQGVVGSQSIRTSWQSLRQAGANAREMLVQAAAQKWGVDKAQCRAENNSVVNTATKARLSYGSLAEAASKLPVPTGVALKDPAQFRIVGKPMKRLDTPSKVNGTAEFGIDVRLPNMKYAVVARCPVFGGKVASFDPAKAKAVPGVTNVLQISNGVAVVADNTWSAMQGKRALEIQWDEGKTAAFSSPGISQTLADTTKQPGQPQKTVGDAVAALASAAKKLDALYEVPYLAHAPMEPLNCVADVRSDRCDIYASTQMQTSARAQAAKMAGLKPDAVQVHTKYLGGGFGRRAQADYVGEATEISKAVGIPIKLTWSREDDLQQDLYRPASVTRFAAGLDADGWPVAFQSQTACTYFGGARTAVEGIADTPYAIPNMLVGSHNVDPGIPVSYWRSVGYSQNTFF